MLFSFKTFCFSLARDTVTQIPKYFKLHIVIRLKKKESFLITFLNQSAIINEIQNYQK